ncbi:hypothetical protein RR48_05196, partial [Papilio machaon]
FVNSKKGKRLLLLDGYTYYEKKVKRRGDFGGFEKLFWACSTHNSRGCNAAVCTLNNTILKRNNEHNHEPNVDNINFDEVILNN